MNHTVMHIHRPALGDYPKIFAPYVESVKGDDIIEMLENNKADMLDFLRAIGWEKWEHAYAPGKWTLAELLVHLIDFERVFAYRALRIARNDPAPMPAYEQDDYVEFSGANERLPASIADEYAAVREASIQLFKNFTDEMWDRRGLAGGNSFTPLAIAYIIAGHEMHHRKMIEQLYL
ncbi:MAG: DinB family protein [Lewinellaceae bacterium]|nr:DinB family protein [Saprospiraceae bacterium]MCB9337288.1 DinB family protein [Lewinellaceae bacterium]